jgi:hypothetical protein
MIVLISKVAVSVPISESSHKNKIAYAVTPQGVGNGENVLSYLLEPNQHDWFNVEAIVGGLHPPICTVLRESLQSMPIANTQVIDDILKRLGGHRTIPCIPGIS